MTSDELILKYATDRWAIKLIGNLPIDSDISMSKLGKDNKALALVQRCYKEMKQEEFVGSIIDYLCYISTGYILLEVSKTVKPGENIANGEKIAEILSYNREEGRNMLRLFMRNPKWFFKLLGTEPDKKIFLNLVGYWFDFYLQDNQTNH